MSALTVCFLVAEGLRVARSTSIDLLLRSDFELVLNDIRYHVTPPESGRNDPPSIHQREKNGEEKILDGVLRGNVGSLWFALDNWSFFLQAVWTKKGAFFDTDTLMHLLWLSNRA